MSPPLAAAVALSVLAAACNPPDTSPRVAYGAAMADVGRRFELLGRALAGGRLELARYELGEIEETFAEDLARAAPPREGHPEALPALERAFRDATLPDLRRALGAGADSAAFARAAAACNACHQASGHGFIEVPAAPGARVPVTDPAPRATDGAPG